MHLECFLRKIQGQDSTELGGDDSLPHNLLLFNPDTYIFGNTIQYCWNVIFLIEVSEGLRFLQQKLIFILRMLMHSYMNSMQWNQSNISCIQSMQSSKCPAYHRCQTDLTSNGSFNSVKKSMNPIHVGSYFLAFPIFVLCIIFAYRVHWKC